MTDYQGENFRYFLKKNKISADKAADILNKNRVTVYQYFKSKNLSREVVSNILTSFKVSESEIWGVEVPRIEAIPTRLADPYG
ncbi:MAG: XRE family transcriptional regulator, partial [Pedobacter sp.]